jgi:thiol-disulfide isomerase/thioredoxin
MLRRILLIIILPMISVMSMSQIKKVYDISFNISGLTDSTIYLAYHLGDKQYLKDSVKISKSGNGSFSGTELLPKGIYMIVLPGRKYFEMLISEDQIFSISCSYSDYFSTLKFYGSDENSAFITYQKKWIKMQEEANSIALRLQNNKTNKDSVQIISELRVTMENRMKGYLNEVISTNKGSLLALLIKAMLPVEVPPVVLPPNTVNPDSVKWMRTYLYNKDHFFDNIDLTDERLLRTPILQGKLNMFFTNVVMQLADSINKEIDKVISKCSGNYKIFQFVSVYLFNHFRESEVMGHDAVMVKIADDIYLSGKADWTTKEWRDNLRNEVDRIRPNLIGVKGHDLVMDTFTGVSVTLYDINKEFIILYFWEPDCGHCQEATPKLKAYYDKAKNEGVEIFTVCTQSDKTKWEKYIRDNNLTWINGWDPKRVTNFDYYYNVQSTPTVYILDKNKVIIAKKLPIESIGSFIDNWRKFNR